MFDRWGAKSHDFYRAVVGMDEAGTIFHADDLGFKTSTMLSPDTLRQLVFPWLRKYAALAHDQGKMFWLHSCGNHFQAGTIEDLIVDMGIVFEMLGCVGPAWVTREGIIVPFYADCKLVALAEGLAAENPQWEAYPVRIVGGNTEMADALRAGIPAITLGGQASDGEMSYWHQVGDTVDKLDPEVMGRAYAFAWAFIRALDTGLADEHR